MAFQAYARRFSPMLLSALSLGLLCSGVSAAADNQRSMTPPPAAPPTLSSGWQPALFAPYLPPPAQTPAEPAVAQQADVPRKLVIHVPSRTLSLYEGGQLKKRYSVGVGRLQFPTPAGQFKVIRKVLQPGWENPYLAPGEMRIAPGRSNPLGSRWIGFHETRQGEYGIHGTDNPESVGRLASHGCVRMLNQDIETVFDWVSTGTPVEVSYETLRLEPVAGGKLQLTLYPDEFGKAKAWTMASLRQAIRARSPQAVLPDTKALLLLMSQAQSRKTIVRSTLAVRQTSPAPTAIATDRRPTQPSGSSSAGSRKLSPTVLQTQTAALSIRPPSSDQKPPQQAPMHPAELDVTP